MKCNKPWKWERRYPRVVAGVVIIVLIDGAKTNAFQAISGNARQVAHTRLRHSWVLFSSKQDEVDQTAKSSSQLIDDDSSDSSSGAFMMTPMASAAKTGTVNERLIAELQEATAQERSGVGRSSAGQKPNNNNKLTQAASFFKSSKTDAERRAAIAEAQNLNGVDPISTLFGALFALTCAVGLWYLTQTLASYFALHPSDSDIYFVERVTLLSRNVIMGLSALASGFFGVTGIGILLLAVRVGFGVVTGELDPTPIASNLPNKAADDSAKVDMSNVLDMMMNKSTKKGQR